MTTPVKFELAKLLKTKGFDEQLKYYYDSFGDIGSSNVKVNWNESEELLCSAPTIAEVVMWLYEKYEIWIWVEREDTTNEFEWLCRYENEGSCKDYDDKFYNSPTEAYEAAIEYCLNNLI